MEAIEWDGKRITRPGLYRGIPMGVYHSQDVCPKPSFSSGQLRRVLEINGGSPAHMYSEWSGNPNRIEPEPTEAMILGRAAHHLLLGEPNFAAKYTMRPKEFDSWRTVASRDWRDRAHAAGLSVLTNGDVESIKGMSRSLRKAVLYESETGEITHVKQLLSGQIEHSLIWQDKITGIWLKSRPDAIPTESGEFADLKTAQSVQYLALIRAIEAYAHHQQAALVREGTKICMDIDMTSFVFVFVFVEKTPPYCVRPVVVKDAYLEWGAKANRAALSVIARCLDENRWPGPGGERTIEYIDLSERYVKQLDHEIEGLKALADIARKTGPRRRQA